ncbi:MAG: hypothetical protein HY588_03365 [Candidatus Omnitrophica bacterium]|nr:hypothetical protein [Candidatus Omnitrophota bacterium]
MSSLEQALIKITRILKAKKIPYMVIGGVANLFLGVPDRTRDREDVRGIISSRRSKLNRKYLDPIVKDLAGSLTKPDLLEFYRSCFR